MRKLTYLHCCVFMLSFFMPNVYYLLWTTSCPSYPASRVCLDLPRSVGTDLGRSKETLLAGYVPQKLKPNLQETERFQNCLKAENVLKIQLKRREEYFLLLLLFSAGWLISETIFV